VRCYHAKNKVVTQAMIEAVIIELGGNLIQTAK